MLKLAVVLLFLTLAAIGGALAQSASETFQTSPPLSEADFQMNALMKRRTAIGKIADNISKTFLKTPVYTWEMGKLIADGKREYEIGLIEVEAVEQMNLAFTAAQKEEIAEQKLVYTAAIGVYGSMIAKTSYSDSSQMPIRGRLSISEKYNIYLKPLDPLRAEISTLAEEIKKNTATRARLREIYALVEQDSRRILAVTTDILPAVEREPDSAGKTTLKKYLEESTAIMKTNLESMAEQKYFDLKDEYDANIQLLKLAIASFDKAQTNDERQKYLREIARLSEADKAIAQKVITGYLKYAADQTVWAKLLAENERNLQYVGEMKLKYKIEF